MKAVMNKLVVGGWLVAAGLCGTVWAEPAAEVDFTFDSPTGTITGYTGAGGDVEIPAKIGGVDVTAIGASAFIQKTTLTSVTIPASVTNVGASAFNACEELASVTFAEGSKLKNVGVMAFHNCGKLVSVTFPSGCPLANIDDAAFKLCGLTSIAIPAGVTNIGERAFAQCPLASITLPEGLTDIGLGAFLMCGELTEITIPASVTNIGMGAFFVCSKLEEVTVLATKPPTAGELLFAADYSGETTIQSLTAIKVPAGSVDRYKDSETGSGWSAYADLITAMSAEPAAAPKGSAENPWPYTGVGGEPGAMYTNENNDVIFVGGKPDTNAEDPWQTLDGLNPKPTKGYFPQGKVTPEELAEYKARGPFTETGYCVEYLTWDEATKTLVPRGCTEYTTVTDTMETLDGGWYVVQGQVTIDRTGITDEALRKPGLKVNGDVHLILADGAELVVTGAMDCAGIEVNVAESVTNSLTIYGQQGQSGKLTVTGGGAAAGLGGSEKQPCGTVTINGGVVAAMGGEEAPGIGTGCEYSGQEVGLLVINAGTVTATAGETDKIGGAGIGAAAESSTGITVIINGGTVSATGGAMAAGIGGGGKTAGGDVTINGGMVRVVSLGACDELDGQIGGGGAGIGGGARAAGANVTITGGEVEAIAYPFEIEGKVYQGEGIGAGASMGSPLSSGTLNLSGYEGVKILAGMDTNGVEVTEVAAADYLDHNDVIGWHTNCYVHILKGEPAAKIEKLNFTLKVVGTYYTEVIAKPSSVEHSGDSVA